MKRLLSGVAMTIFAIAMSTSVFANSAINEFPLEQTGTTYEFIDISFSSAVSIDGIAAIEEIIPELQILSSDINAKRVPSGQLEVRFASEFTVSKEKAKALGSAYFSKAINEIVSLAAEQDVTIPPDLDDPEFQFFVKSQALETSDRDIIELVKFIDIYENYEYNLKMEELVFTLENTVFSSTTEFITDAPLHELLSMMPITGASTAETAPVQSVVETTEGTLSLSGYNANAAVNYAAEWWNKTNNTDFGYYAMYANHKDPTNDNMWSGGTGIDRRNWNDCANFVSQCLSCGGAAQVGWNPATQATDNEYWFYSGIRPSYSWGGASNFYYHWGPRVGTRSNATLTQKGDPVSVDKSGDGIHDNTLIITSVNKAT